MSPVLALLKEMRGRPIAIYVGEASLTRLAAFLRGFDYAVERLNGGMADAFLGDFQQWVRRRFQTDKYTWDGTILRQSADERAAVQRFWELLDEYLLERAADPSAQGSRPDGEIADANGAVGLACGRKVAG